MYQLIIRRQDNSIYWIEHFNTSQALDLWLATEKTRPYWVSSYTTEITVLS